MGNPEFTRNVWLELTPHRLVIGPVLLGLIFYLVWASNQSSPLDELASISGGLYFLLAVVWGAWRAADGLASEVRGGTWDAQRLSAQTPWSLTWGKLFGSTIYVWYVCLMSFAVFVVASALDGTDPFLLFTRAYILLAGATICHGLSFILTLLAVRKQGTLSRRQMKSVQTGAILFGFWAVITLSGPLFQKHTFDIDWYDMPIGREIFLVVSTSLFLGWILLGCYQLMSSELQVKKGPWAWLAFSLFVMVYVAGFPDMSDVPTGSARLSSRVLIGAGVGLFMAYAILISEPKGPSVRREMIVHWMSGDWGRFWPVFPRWVGTLLLYVFSSLLFMVLSSQSPEVEVSRQLDEWASPGLLLGLFLLFFLRDAAIFLLLNQSSRALRADMVGVIYLLILYLLVPSLLGALGLKGGLLVFWAWADEGETTLRILAPLVEGMFLWGLVLGGWQHFSSPVRASAMPLEGEGRGGGG